MRGSDRDELKTENERLRAELSEQSDNNIALEGQFSRIRGEFNTIFDTVSALIWYQGKDGRLLRVNKAAAMSVNMTPQEMVGKDYYELFGNDSDQARSKDNEVISSGKPIIGDLSRFESIDGQVRYAMVDRYPYRDEKGEIVGLVGFAQDVTERKAADDALRDAQAELERTNEQLSKSLAKSDYLAKQAVSANKAKSRFVAAVSHDSRTAINAVLGFSELLLEEDLGKDQLGYVKVIKSAAGSILELTNDILDLASMEANKLEIKTARESLGSIVSKVVELLTHSASNKGIEFDVLAEGEVPTHIVTDSMRFRQCLVNLVSNAIKFTECGHVHIIVSTRIDNEKPFICVSVEDTGIGIPADMQEAIFESFSQGGADTKSKYGGTGLGLTITSKLASLLGGRIEVASEPGRGSTFTILLPDLCGVEDGLFDPSQVMAARVLERSKYAEGDKSPILSDYAYVDQMHDAIYALAVKLPKISKKVISALGKGDHELVGKLLDVLVDAGENAGYPVLVEKVAELQHYHEDFCDSHCMNIAEQLGDICDRIADGCRVGSHN